MVLILTDSDVVRVLNMNDGIDIIEQAFREHGNGKTILLPRISHTLADSRGAFRIMAAGFPSLGWFGLKTLTGYPGRRHPGETYISMLLFEIATGALRAVIAAKHLTGIRTGAATGVAAKYLARKDADVLGIFGIGAQARYQLEAVMAVRPLRLVKVLSRDHVETTAFADSISKSFDVEVNVVASPREIVYGSSLIIAATTSRMPLFPGEWLEPGTHVSGIGANTPSKRELDSTCFVRSKVVVDFREQAIEEAGDLREAISAGAIKTSDIYAELSEIVTGTKQGRCNNDELTMFKSVGIAIEDVAAAAFVYEEATKRGVGTSLELEQFQQR